MGYQFSYDKVPGHKFGVKSLSWNVFENNNEKNLEKVYIYLLFLKKNSSVFKSPASGMENVRAQLG